MSPLKIMVVGDGAVGKSSLLITAHSNSFPSEYVPTVFDNYVSPVIVDGKTIEVAFWDTAGQEDYDRLRPLAYPCTDVFMICFAINDRNSLENSTRRWYDEVHHYMPDVPIMLVGCKSDLRSEGGVTYEDAKHAAENIDAIYVETSALLQKGVKECMDKTVRAGLDFDETSKKLSKSGGFFSRFKFKNNTPQPPVMPPAGKAPWLEVQTAVFAGQWMKMLENPLHANVTFIVGGKRQVQAHSIILAGASKFFRRILKMSQSNEPNQLESLLDEGPISSDLLNSGKVIGIVRMFEENTDGNLMTFIELAENITAKTLAYVLQFLYTGSPILPFEPDDEELQLLIDASSCFKLPYLEAICANRLHDEEFLNPSIGTFLNDETGQMLKALYLNNKDRADISFKVQGEIIWANKAILTARCEVMAAMFSGHFAEGNTIAEIEVFDTSPETMLALLEYLYTDHAPIEEGDSVGILVLANQYCLPRLVTLCELYITKEVDRACSKEIQKSEIDVIGLMLTAQLHNAEQLANWCLHFISTNYQAFSQREEFVLLTGFNLEHVEKNQWPPVLYLKEVGVYEAQMKARGEKCLVM